MTYAAVPLVPRKVLFADPERATPEISPDGELLGYLAPHEGAMNLWVEPLDKSRPPRPVTDDRRRGISAFGFCHDDRSIVYLRDTDGDENWRLYRLDRREPDRPAECLTPYDGASVRILAHNRWHPEVMLLGLNDRDERVHDIHLLTLEDGALRLVRTNPGYAGWLIDADLRIRGAVEMCVDGDMLLRLGSDHDDDSPDGLRPWRRIPAEDAATTAPIGFDRTGRILYLLSARDANATRLLAVDPANGAERVLAAHPRYDVARVERDPVTLRPQAVVFTADRERWVWLDTRLGRRVERLRSGLPTDGELRLGRSDRDDRVWLLSVTGADSPTVYVEHRPPNRPNDVDAGSTRPLFDSMPALAPYRLASMEPFDFTARDGLSICGYLTFPPGAERHRLPAVVDVHGGPWTRDIWGFNPEVQWLANRGYLCVQVNFRGSRGYGKAFCAAGDKEWGRRMLDDVVDAVRHCVGSGWVDPDRVGVMGTSYGGYTALAGAAFRPGVFRCAVDMCGPTNLLTLLDSIPPHWRPMVGFMHTRVGDPATESDMLWDRSPLSRADAIDIPLLIAHGANDPRVKPAETDQIIAALTRKGLPHVYLTFPDEGHGLVRSENRERYYRAVERFLSDHLGGRFEP